MRAHAILAFVVAFGVGSGCGSARPRKPPEALQCGLERFQVKDIYDPEYRLKRAIPSAFNVLALSAGGEFGAYGAGFLSGWGSLGDAAIPSRRADIQVVTGVSTGAIMATHAFLGDDSTLVQLYTHLTGARIYERRSTLSYLWADSIYSTTGKERLISDNITGDIVRRVVDVADHTDRRLYLGVVDLDSGEFVRIDMVSLAREVVAGKADLDCYRAVISASSAIPVAFPPRFVDDRMLVDGGARWHLFLTEPPAGLGGKNVERRIFSFVHGDLDAGSERVGNGVLQIALRTSEVLTDQSVKSSVRWMDVLAHGGPAGDLPRFEIRYASAAGAACACAAEKQTCTGKGAMQGEDMFCQPFMRCLAGQGEADGAAYAAGTRPWLELGDIFPAQPRPCEPRVPRRLMQ